MTAIKNLGGNKIFVYVHDSYFDDVIWLEPPDAPPCSSLTMVSAGMFLFSDVSASLRSSARKTCTRVAAGSHFCPRRRPRPKIDVPVICMLMRPQPVASPREAPDVVRRGREC